MSLCTQEVQSGKRFEFGENWREFLSTIDDERISVATMSLLRMLDCDSLSGKRFLDVGSGSGLFSLAARKAGARVHSFDYDPQAVACAVELKNRHCPLDHNWTIGEGSILDSDYIRSLGQFDIVYAWGVLHHTGAMWRAIENAMLPVAENGLLWIAIYNDHGWISTYWKHVKQLYCSGRAGQFITLTIGIPYFVLAGAMSDMSKGENPIRSYSNYKSQRGMSIMRDWHDWLGGYPFEFAKPQEIESFTKARGFALRKLRPCGGKNGNNQFLLMKQLQTFASK